MTEIKPLQKVLIANRGEIAVRVIRACKDAGIGSVAVYADPDRDALFVRLADEAYAPGRRDPGRLLPRHRQDPRRRRSGPAPTRCTPATASWPRTPASRRPCSTPAWSGSARRPRRSSALGDKVQARHIAEKVGAPLVAGTQDPVDGRRRGRSRSRESTASRSRSRRPSAAAGAGSRWPARRSEVAELYESAVREAVTAFGRGECFVERYLDKPRHVETQCLADQHGNVVVVSTRDCSLQRRHQKLVEEAPGAVPLRRADRPRSTSPPRRSCARPATSAPAPASSWSARTARSPSSRSTPGSRSSTRVTEEVTGIDLVREMFRIAAGEELGYDDPVVRGHSIEFRINAEDAGRNFMPAPGTLTRWHAAVRPRRPARRRLRPGRDRARLVRLPGRQADRHRPRPRPGAGALPPGARRVRRRRACRP